MSSPLNKHKTLPIENISGDGSGSL